MLHEQMAASTLLMSSRNILDIVKYFPLTGSIKEFIQAEMDLLEKRNSLGKDARKDVFAELVHDENGNPRPWKKVLGDVDLLVVAGSGESLSCLPFSSTCSSSPSPQSYSCTPRHHRLRPLQRHVRTLRLSPHPIYAPHRAPHPLRNRL